MSLVRRQAAQRTSSPIWQRLASYGRYSIIGAAAITYPLSGQSPWVYIGLMLFVIYAPFHDKVQKLLGWDESNTRIQAPLHPPPHPHPPPPPTPPPTHPTPLRVT